MKPPKVKQSESFIVYGEPCAKANSRIMIFRNGKPRSIKNKASQDYVNNFIRQVQVLKIAQLKGDVILHCTIFYRSYRKDLDESLIMDCLQKSGVLENDRQIKEKHIFHAIDKDNPRIIVNLQSQIKNKR